MCGMKGRYEQSVKHAKYILDAYENKKNRKDIETSIYPQRMSQLYCIYLKSLMRMHRFAEANQFVNNKDFDHVIWQVLDGSPEYYWFHAIHINIVLRNSITNVEVRDAKFAGFQFYKEIIIKESRQYSAYSDVLDCNYVNFLIIARMHKKAMAFLEKKLLTARSECGYMHYLSGLLQHKHFQAFDHAKYHYFASMEHNTEISEARWHLAKLMKKLKEYKMALHHLKKGIAMNSGLLVYDRSDVFLHKLRKKAFNLKCANCGRCNRPRSDKEKRLFICKGCGKYYFCNKKCQKIYWKKVHRNECDRSYISIFKNMKNTDSYSKCKFHRH